MTNTNDPRKFPFPPALPVIGWLLSWGLQKLTPVEVPWPPWSLILGIMLCVLPLSFAIWAAVTFKRHNTVVNPLGEATTIVDAGPFHWTRNPMYLSLLVLFVGGTFVFKLEWAPLFFIPLFLALHFGVILPEEKYLEAKFGEKYLSYKKRVRRWL